jgi:beta-glucuronidase
MGTPTGRNPESILRLKHTPHFIFDGQQRTSERRTLVRCCFLSRRERRETRKTHKKRSTVRISFNSNMDRQRLYCITVLFLGCFCAIAAAIQHQENASLDRVHPVISANAQTPRYWPRYSGRRTVVLLDGVWNSSRLDDDGDGSQLLFDSMDPNLDPSTIATPQQSQVPSTVDNTLPGFLGYRGVSFFRTIFRPPLSVQSPARIQFQACSFYCRVWVNGKEIGDHHAGGYVAFSLDVKAEDDQNDASTVELFVLADNRWNSTTAPVHTGGDFWHYGGILRSVEWHVLPSYNEEVWPWRLFVFPQTDLKSVKLQLQLTDLSYEGSLPQDISLLFDENHPEPDHQKGEESRMVVIPAGSISTSAPGILDLGSLRVPSPRIWSTDNPQLHTISIELNGAVVQERFGMRYWDIAEDEHGASRIRLNGEILKLVGWNHHTQWPDTAASPTDDQMDSDIELLKNGNANFV